MADLDGRNVLIGVSGGIAAYKIPELARLLVKAGACVKVVMTEGGCQFVTPLTFRTLTGNPVATTLWSDPCSAFPHISLSDEADLIVVAPATANIIAKMANGIGDDLLSTTLIAARSPVVVAPTMNSRMYLNPVTQENLRKIRETGAIVVDPSEGSLACRTQGVGRMAEPPEIMAVIERELALRADLSGKRILVTAGPTREHIDPVRFLSNPSTGLMGYAVAERASRRGAIVTLVSGPVGLPCPVGVERVDVVSAEEMKGAVIERLEENDVLVMAAAVADYTVSSPSATKVKKSGGVPRLELKATDDIIKSITPLKGGRIVVGFAAETDSVVENALGKLVDKDLDLIVANQVAVPGSGFGASTDLAAVISRGQKTAELELMSKAELADLLLDRLSGLFRD